MRRGLRRLLGRRERVVPVVTRAGRRRWERSAPDDWAARLHLLYLLHRDRAQAPYFARSGSYRMPRPGLARACRWYVADVLVQALQLVRRRGRAVRTAAGVPVRRQLWQVLWLSIAVPAMPEKYFQFEWYRPENRARAGEYLHRHETKGGLYALLGDERELADLAPLDDKAAFAAHATTAGLPVAPTLAVVGDGVEPAGELPRSDLFVKPVVGKGGRGARRLRYDREADRVDGVPRSDLLARLAGTGGPALLVQPCLPSHGELAALALDALATCRVVTILDETGQPEPVIAIFRMPGTRDTVVDNLHRGGLAAPVEIASGVLGAASGYAVTGPPGRQTHHPVSGAVIAGRTLPRWVEVRALAIRAHQAFRPRVLVGWDIGVGPDGPVLVEGNAQPGVDGLQRLHDRPLGTHRFGELLAHHLAGLAR